ncbi:MAG: hypothetical protein R6U70_01050 [Bacillota bacterium]
MQRLKHLAAPAVVTLSILLIASVAINIRLSRSLGSADRVINQMAGWSLVAAATSLSPAQRHLADAAELQKPDDCTIHLILADQALAEFDEFVRLAAKDMPRDPEGNLLSVLSRTLYNAMKEAQLHTEPETMLELSRAVDALSETLLPFGNRLLAQPQDKVGRDDLYRELAETVVQQLRERGMWEFVLDFAPREQLSATLETLEISRD